MWLFMIINEWEERRERLSHTSQQNREVVSLKLKYLVNFFVNSSSRLNQ